MKKFTLILFLTLLTALSFSQHPAPPAGFAVLELFTSQGCSSCPPADKLLGRLMDDAQKNKQPVYAMEFHVDYWNKYGWKDPYSSFKYTVRQRNYVSVLPETQAYTPQLIVNGQSVLLGSDEKLAREAVEKALKTSAVVKLEIKPGTMANDTMMITYSASVTDKNYSLKIALVERSATNPVSKGENAGKVLVHHNVVTSFSSYDLNSKTGEVKLPLNKQVPGRNHMIIAFVQNRQSLKILGATSNAGW